MAGKGWLPSFLKSANGKKPSKKQEAGVT